jgi:hypothetical protein
MTQKKICKVVVEHGWYGCETGCCGYWIKATYEDGSTRKVFEFAHPDAEPPMDFARELAKKLFDAPPDVVETSNSMPTFGQC